MHKHSHRVDRVVQVYSFVGCVFNHILVKYEHLEHTEQVHNKEADCVNGAV